MKTRIAALALTLAALLCLTAVASAEVLTSYTAYNNTLIEAVGWYFSYDTTLFMTGENTYALMFKTNVFGTNDPGNKGEKTVIYTGTCTTAPAADDEAAHLDITLDTCDNVYFEQHDKGWGRQVLNFQMMLNTAAWTSDMDDLAQMSRDEFLANHSVAGTVITVEDLFLDLDDVTLMNQILLINGAEPTVETLTAFDISE